MRSSKWTWGSLLLASLLGIIFAGAPDIAEAKQHHSYSSSASYSKKGKKSRRGRSSGSMSVRSAQIQLTDLGYYSGSIDGRFGPSTKRALKAFQRDQGIRVTGRLDAATRRILSRNGFGLRGPGIRQGNVIHRHISKTSAPLIEGPMLLVTRFGSFDVDEVRNEGSSNAMRSYVVKYNGQPVLNAPNQPGELRVSQTFEVEGDDLIVFTVYTGHADCFYENTLFVFKPDGSYVEKPIPVCAGENAEHIKNSSLFIEFPNGYDGSTTGVTWRYERGMLEPLM